MNNDRIIIKHIDTQRILNLCIDGLLTDGGHHKQWYIERILEAINVDLEKLHCELNEDGYDWKPGIAP